MFICVQVCEEKRLKKAAIYYRMRKDIRMKVESAYLAQLRRNYRMADAYIEKGTTYEIDGKVYECLEFLHVKPGKGSAFVRTKLKDVINGGVVERTFNPSKDVLKKAFIERKEVQYLYNDGGLYYFMDMETFEQTPVGADDVGDALKFVKENEVVSMKSYQGKVFAIEPPFTVELLITESEPGVKGNTATGATKPAIVETGAQVMVPLFVEQGEKIKIDTRTGQYLSRA